MDIDRQLGQWNSGLPAGLEILNGLDVIRLAVDSKSESLRFRVVMTLRYYSLSTLLHRKVLEWLLVCPTSTLSGPEITEFLWTIIKGSIDMCSQSARDTILVVASLADHHILLPIWWYSVYYGASSFVFRHKGPGS
jgi:hypothetical protein